MFSLDDLVTRLGGEPVGDGAVRVSRVASLEQAGAGDLCFLSNLKYVGKLESSNASAFIVGAAARDLLAGRHGIIAEDPYLYYAYAAQLLNPLPAIIPGVHLTAAVSTVVPSSVSIAAGATVEADVELGADVVIGAGAYVGQGVRIGAGTRLAPRSTVHAGCIIGECCQIHSGAVIGADGFGFARKKDGGWVKIPQVGRVVIGDDVEIGANTTVDRGTLEDTVIEEGAKLDNLIQIAHNVRIGKYTAIAGCVGIAGSTRIGARCMIGGQAGISGHLHIADDVIISAGTIVTKSIHKPGVYTGVLPLQTHADWIRNFSHLRHLNTWVETVRMLKQRSAGDGSA